MKGTNLKNFFKAAKSGNEEDVLSFLEKKVNINATSSKQCNTVLMIAAKYGHQHLIKRLLAKNASINLTNLYHMDALMIAAHYGKTAAIDLLIEAKIDPQSKCFLNNYTAIMFAVVNEKVEFTNALMKKGVKFPAPSEFKHFSIEMMHKICQMIMILREDQKGQFITETLQISYLIASHTWSIVADYYIDFPPPSQSNCFCVSFWNLQKPTLNQEKISQSLRAKF